MGPTTSSLAVALNARLRVALNRARDLETKLARALEEAGNDDDYSFDSSGGNSGLNTPYKSGSGDLLDLNNYSNNNNAGSGLTRKRGGRQVVSISRAINLNDSNSQMTPSKEKISKVIDEVDMWSINTGVFLKRNPLARAAAVLYLIVLHVWVMGILIFHAHNFEVEHGDFGSYRHLDNLHGHPAGWEEEQKKAIGIP